MRDRRTEIIRIIKDTRSLPTLPGIITKLSSLADDGKVSVDEMARVVTSDQVLSAKVLKLVNSPFYGFSGRISTVSKALILLGVNVVKSLAISSSIFDIMEKNIVGLWEHSLGAAVAANIIARELNLPEREEISTAALLHDIGKVIIKLKLEEDYDHLVNVIKEKELPMIDCERELFNIDHAEIGEWLGKSWLLPEKLIEPIACHHHVEKSNAQRAKTAVVHIADVLTKASGFGFSGDDFVPHIQKVAWEKLGLTHLMLKEIVEELEDNLIEAKNFSMDIQSKSGQQT
ncbi:MAG: HDOD domain-containing protein [Nitrospirae bacterium]|nr:HDOD domain-containing protein [Nitrospirota bacterium]